MSANKASESSVQLDLSDVDPRVGKPVGGGQLWDACSATDIRRWVHAMDYANPIHWREDIARESKFGGIVAPQSFTVSMDFAHGCQPACVGKIPGSHLIFGGEEWWFYGTRVRPGDRLFQKRRFDGYKVTETKFAGPTMFSNGETVHRNQHGALVAKERATAIRYLAAEAEKRGMYADQLTPVRKWKSAELIEVDKVRRAWIESIRHGVSPHWDEVKVGDQLPRRVLGPHNVATFTTEYRAFMQDCWGAWGPGKLGWDIPDIEDPWTTQDAGWIDDFKCNYEDSMIDPRLRDGLYTGPSRGHVDDSKAGEIGMARAYGYGATMGAWVHDYVAGWAGNDGFIWHSKMQFRGPAFEGDVTYFEGEVVAKNLLTPQGVPLITIKLRLANQDGGALVEAMVDVEVPL
jgi:acyl dehydratase/uncharacterized protein YnzC (UPF0291/DUF896 family)